MTTKTLLSTLFLATLVAGFSPRVRADDGKEAPASPDELYRLGKVAETVDRDVPRAMSLYGQAFQKGDADAALDAGLALARLQEETGKPAEAFDTYAEVEKRFAARLDEAGKQAVHDALVRLWTPEKGPTIVTPLGEVKIVGADGRVVAGAVAKAPSPLEEKIRDLFHRYEDAEPNQRSQAESRLRLALSTVGTAALPALEEAIVHRGPEAAGLAARLYAAIGKADALPGLERLFREGDAFVRKAVVSGLYQLPRTVETKPLVVAALDRLLALPDVGQDADSLRRLLANGFLAPEQEFQRHHQGGPEASFWLAVALHAHAKGALERALELIREGGDAGKDALVSLVPLLKPGAPCGYPPDTLSGENAKQALSLLVSVPYDGSQQMADALVGLARRVGETEGEEAGEKAAEEAWQVLLEPEHGASVVKYYGRARFLPPTRLLQDDRFVTALFGSDAIQPWGGANQGWTTTLGSLRQDLWDAFLRVSAKLPEAAVVRVMHAYWNAYSDRDSPPESQDHAWLGLLLSAPPRDAVAFPSWVYRAAARTGDPRFLDVLAGILHDPAVAGTQFAKNCSTTIDSYDGPGRLEWIRARLAEADAAKLGSSFVFLKVLASERDEKAHALLIQIASDPSGPLARSAVGLLDDAGEGDALLAIARAIASGKVQPDHWYRIDVMTAIGNLHLREAIPFLLHEFEDRDVGISKKAAETMDQIRAWYERVRTFEAFAKEKDQGETEASETKRILDLLGDPDPVIRRAAALSLGALARKDALARLVSLGKDDPDPSVREAALQAVEKIAAAR